MSDGELVRHFGGVAEIEKVRHDRADEIRHDAVAERVGRAHAGQGDPSDWSDHP